MREEASYGLCVQITMRGRNQRARNVSTADVKPYHLRPLTLRHSLADTFARYARGRGLKLPSEAVKTTLFDSLVIHRWTTSPSGTAGWEYKRRSNEGVESGWLADNDMLQSVTTLQLDGFITLRHLHTPSLQTTQSPSQPSPVRLSLAAKP